MKMGATVRSQAMVYKTLDQTVIFYGSDSWLVVDVMLKVLEGFHHRVACSITGSTDWKVGGV